MKIYSVIWQDRHSDTTSKPFLDLDEAIMFARSAAKALVMDPKFYIERPIDGWLFYAEYSCEGDCIWITEDEVGLKKPTN